MDMTKTRYPSMEIFMDITMEISMDIHIHGKPGSLELAKVSIYKNLTLKKKIFLGKNVKIVVVGSAKFSL